MKWKLKVTVQHARSMWLYCMQSYKPQSIRMKEKGANDETRVRRRTGMVKSSVTNRKEKETVVLN